MPKTTTFYKVENLNKALRRLPKEASARLRDASVDIAAFVADDARSRGSGIGRQWRIVAPTIKATRDRVPVIKFGGSARIAGKTGSNLKNQTVGNLIWGTEFGGGKRPHTQGFLPHLGTTGYAIYPTIRAHRQDIFDAYDHALLDALRAI